MKKLLKGITVIVLSSFILGCSNNEKRKNNENSIEKVTLSFIYSSFKSYDDSNLIYAIPSDIEKTFTYEYGHSLTLDDWEYIIDCIEFDPSGYGGYYGVSQMYDKSENIDKEKDCLYKNFKWTALEDTKIYYENFGGAPTPTQIANEKIDKDLNIDKPDGGFINPIKITVCYVEVDDVNKIYNNENDYSLSLVEESYLKIYTVEKGYEIDEGMMHAILGNIGNNNSPSVSIYDPNKKFNRNVSFNYGLFSNYENHTLITNFVVQEDITLYYTRITFLTSSN